MTFVTLPSGESYSVSPEFYDLLVLKEEEIARLKVELADCWKAGGEAMRKAIAEAVIAWGQSNDERNIDDVIADAPLPEMKP